MTFPKATLGLLAAAIAFIPLTASADSGFYIGGSAGGATLEADFGDSGIPGFPQRIDEDDTALKGFAGFVFDLPLIDLAVEAGYVDFGEPEINISGEQIVLDTTGVNLWGIAALESGPIDLFAKLGYISWDVETSFDGARFTDDGSDIGYGLGLSFGLGPVKVRGEYETYDLDEADLSMLSLGISYQFN
ncbi:MAG: outer membrane beta-barrel protein [Woeseia sp.]|nr:outer membrane beta-barrel protein [Woeseia sp.]